MASTSGGGRKRLVSTLEGEILERLSMKLNPRMLMKDYQSLAGRLKYTYEYIRNFARERDPTLALLQHWWSSSRGREKTVSVLIEHLIEMERDDAVDLLRPHEFYSSQGASDNDETERPVIAGAIDMNVNPYNPYFPARQDFQRQANENRVAKPDIRANTGNQRFPVQRENEHHQRNASCPPGVLNQGQWPPNNVPRQDQLSQRMFNMRLSNNYPENPPGMVPSTTSESFPNGSYPSNYPSAVISNANAPTSFPNSGSRASSVSSSMDSLQFEKYFMENENRSKSKTPSSPPYHAPEPPRLPDNNNMFRPTTADDFYARRDLRFHGVRSRPHPLDGSSVSSSEAGVHQGYYDGYEGTAAAAGTHSITAAADKVALVIGNQDYAHHKLRGLLYPEQDAADVAAALTRLSFKVISLVNLTLEEMRTAMLAFCCLLGRGVYGVVYYAGHGYEDNGENYLLPVDSDLKYNREHSLRTQEILEAMQQCETSLNLLIIDACRVSLPNKSGTKVPRIKRNATGNNIFAYSCCSQQESLEQSNCRNGMYCSHLLRRLGENRRVENILMDVAQDFARAYNLPQRPCLETDSMVDFRLTDPIQPEILSGLEQEYLERCRRWLVAKHVPPDFAMAGASLAISVNFSAPFSNILCVSVVTERKMEKSVKDFHLRLETVSPLICVLKACEEPTRGNVVCIQKFEIQNIQKHTKLKGHIMLTVTAMFREDDKVCQIEKEVDLWYPLVASITCLWDHWLLGDRCKTTAV